MASRRAGRRPPGGGPRRVTSFVIRFVEGTSPGASASSWYGTIRHVQSGREVSFSRLNEALAFMVEILPVHVLGERV